VSDGSQATMGAISKEFPASARQRCVVHKMDNVRSLVPSKQQEQLKPELKALFYQKDRQAADQVGAAFIEKYQKIYPTAIDCHEPRFGSVSDLLRFPEGPLEDDPEQ
jgi:putative transposase